MTGTDIAILVVGGVLAGMAVITFILLILLTVSAIYAALDGDWGYALAFMAAPFILIICPGIALLIGALT
jgi:hypothetical protein